MTWCRQMSLTCFLTILLRKKVNKELKDHLVIKSNLSDCMVKNKTVDNFSELEMSYTANRLLVQRQARWCMPSLWIAYWRKERLGISSYIWTIKTIQKLISKHLINSPKSVFNSVLYNLGLKLVISLSQKFCLLEFHKKSYNTKNTQNNFIIW